MMFKERVVQCTLQLKGIIHPSTNKPYTLYTINYRRCLGLKKTRSI